MFFIHKQAAISIAEISDYIAGEGYPERAIDYLEKMYKFAESLSFFPYKYPICRFSVLKTLKLRCAVFDKYIFIYKIQNDDVVLINVVHSSLLKN